MRRKARDRDRKKDSESERCASGEKTPFPMSLYKMSANAPEPVNILPECLNVRFESRWRVGKGSVRLYTDGTQFQGKNHPLKY